MLYKHSYVYSICFFLLIMIGSWIWRNEENSYKKCHLTEILIIDHLKTKNKYIYSEYELNKSDSSNKKITVINQLANNGNSAFQYTSRDEISVKFKISSEGKRTRYGLALMVNCQVIELILSEINPKG